MSVLVFVASGSAGALPGEARGGQQENGEFSITPAEGPVGTVVTIASVTPCPPAPDPEARNQVVLFIGIPTILELPAEGGRWEFQTEMQPFSPTSNVLEIPAECNWFLEDQLGSGETTLVYEPVRFTFTDLPPEAPPAPGVLAEPRFTE